MDLMFFIYLAGVSEKLYIFSICLAIFLGIIAFVCIGSINEARTDEDRKNCKYFFKIYASLAVLFFAISVVIPDSKTMYAMAAAHYGEKAIKSETFQRLNSKALNLLEVKIDEMLEDQNARQSK